MRKILLLMQILIITLFFSSYVCAEEALIGMLIEKENTATYIETLDGFRKQLSRSGEKYNFIKRNARKNRKIMELIARDFAANPAIRAVVVLGSAAASIANMHVRNKPVVFGGVNHPGGLGINGDNITGTTYFIDPSIVIHLVVKLNPLIKKIGMLYESGEQNAASLIEVPLTDSALKKHGIEFVTEEVKAKDDIVHKTKILIDSDIEYLIIPTNKLLYNNVNLIRSVSDAATVPVVSFSKKGVENGALIAITSNNYNQGEKMAQMLIEIMKQEKSPNEIEWYFPKKYTIFISERTRATLGLSIQQKIYNIATLLHTDSKKGLTIK